MIRRHLGPAAGGGTLLALCLVFVAKVFASTDYSMDFFNSNGQIYCGGDIGTNDPEGILGAVEGRLDNPNGQGYTFHNHVTHPTTSVTSGVWHAADVPGTWTCYVSVTENWLDPYPVQLGPQYLVVQ